MNGEAIKMYDIHVIRVIIIPTIVTNFVVFADAILFYSNNNNNNAKNFTIIISHIFYPGLSDSY